jgi:hypothetical protein
VREQHTLTQFYAGKLKTNQWHLMVIRMIILRLLVYLFTYGVTATSRSCFFLIWVRTTWTWWYSDFCTKGLRARILKRTCQVWISLIFTLTRFCYNIIYEVWTHLITRYYHKYSLISRWICLKFNFLVVSDPDSVSHVGTFHQHT